MLLDVAPKGVLILALVRCRGQEEDIKLEETEDMLRQKSKSVGDGGICGLHTCAGRPD